MKKTQTLLNRHQLLDLAALQGWLEHNLDPVQRADQLLTLRPEELNCIFDTLPTAEGAALLSSLSADCAGRLLMRLHASIVSVLQGPCPVATCWPFCAGWAAVIAPCCLPASRSRCSPPLLPARLADRIGGRQHAPRIPGHWRSGNGG